LVFGRGTTEDRKPITETEKPKTENAKRTRNAHSFIQFTDCLKEGHES